MRSLQARLAIAVSAVAAVIAIIAGLWSFSEAFEQARESQDKRLTAIASLFSRYDPEKLLRLRSGPESKFDSFIVVDRIGAVNDQFFGLPVGTQAGYRTAVVAGESWRVFVNEPQDGRQALVVGQRTIVRDRIAWNAGLWTAVPLLLLAPILCALIFLLVRHMMRPVAQLSRDLNRRTDSDLGPLAAAGQPSEIAPIVVAINDLMLRLGRSRDTQRRFVADAAHELRSPLAALSLQIENVYGLALAPEVASRLEPLRLGIARARSLTEQLLALAHVQVSPGIAPARCNVEDVLRSVVEGLLPVADGRNVEIGVTRLESHCVEASEIDLALVLRNVLDNAIRYCRPGTTVEVGTWKCGTDLLIEVKDHGPGIPVAERERVFDAFYRIPGNGEQGTGLGLSIVKAVTRKLGARIELAWSTDNPERGLRVRIAIPLT